MLSYLLAVRARELLPQIIMGIVVRKIIADTTAQMMNTAERPVPSIHLDNDIATAVARAFRTNVTATRESPTICSKIARDVNDSNNRFKKR